MKVNSIQFEAMAVVERNLELIINVCNTLLYFYTPIRPLGPLQTCYTKGLSLSCHHSLSLT